MISLKSNQRMFLGLGVVYFLFIMLIVFSTNAIYGEELKNEGDLKNYEKKSLFIFPILHDNKINSSLLSNDRINYLRRLMHYMFVMDFGRIDFFDVSSDDSIGNFLHDTHAFLLRNIKNIVTKRRDADGKVNEVLITDEELLKASKNSFALVPYIDSVEKTVIQAGSHNSYIYSFYVHFDIYSTKTKGKIKTLKINNTKNVLGSLASFMGSLQVDNRDINGLPTNERNDEAGFRSAIAGLFTVLKKEMKKMPEFCIMAELSMVKSSKFGFDMGKDIGIKIDHRYKTVVTKQDGRKKMTGFGKIRKVQASYSEAQVLIGRPREGDQVVEVPKIGINFVGGFGTVPLHIAIFEDIPMLDIVSGSHKALSLGVEFELGPLLGNSEWYVGINLRLGLPSTEDLWKDYFTVSQFIINMGVIKKLYLRRLAINLGGFIGIHGASVTYEKDNEISGGSLGFTMNAGIEYMITPSVSVFGCGNLDYYSNPDKITYNDTSEDFPEGCEWNAKGFGMNFGVKVTF